MPVFPSLSPAFRTGIVLALLLVAQVCVAIAFLRVPGFGFVPREAGLWPYRAGIMLFAAGAVLLTGPATTRFWGALQLGGAAILLLLPAIVLTIWLQTDGDPGAGYRLPFAIAFLLPGALAAIGVRDALRP